MIIVAHSIRNTGGVILFSQLSTILKIVIIGIVYIIIFISLKIMYNDIKNGGKKKASRRRKFGLEIVSSGKNTNLKAGGVIPLNGNISIGRKEENQVVLMDPYVSGHHARIYLRNDEYILEDLGSTNGIMLNGHKLEQKYSLKSGDEIGIGSAIFKVIG